MEKVLQINIKQENSIIAKSIEKSDYSDAYRIEIYNQKNYSVYVLTVKFFTSLPTWVKFLLRLRDIAVKPFGLTGGSIEKIDNIDNSVIYKPGQKVVFFTVYDRNKYEIVMAEDDKHLDFRTSVRIEKANKKNYNYLYSSTIVKYNNFGGKLYFALVKPFHKLIIKSLLKSMANNHKK